MKVAATFRSLPSVGFPVGTTVAVNVGVAGVASGDFAKSREANLFRLKVSGSGSCLKGFFEEDPKSSVNL